MLRFRVSYQDLDATTHIGLWQADTQVYSHAVKRLELTDICNVSILIQTRVSVEDLDSNAS